MQEAIKLIQEKIIIPRMQEQKVSKYKLSKATEISESHLSLWFSGQTEISLGKFLKILQVLGIQPFFEYGDQSEAKYKLSVNNDYGYDWICVDTKNYVVIEWKNRKLNDTQKVTFIEGDPDPSQGANWLRKMTDWLFLHHKEKIQ